MTNLVYASAGTNIACEVMKIIQKVEKEKNWEEKMAEKKSKAKEKRLEEIKRREELQKNKGGGAKKGGKCQMLMQRPVEN